VPHGHACRADRRLHYRGRGARAAVRAVDRGGRRGRRSLAGPGCRRPDAERGRRRMTAPTTPSPRRSRAAAGAPTTDEGTTALLCHLLRDYYGRGWVAGTGGGICGPTRDGNLF